MGVTCVADESRNLWLKWLYVQAVENRPKVFRTVCQVNGFNLENVTHDEAANALKNTQDFVRLVIAKAVPPPTSGPMSIMSPRRRAPPLGM